MRLNFLIKLMLCVWFDKGDSHEERLWSIRFEWLWKMRRKSYFLSLEKNPFAFCWLNNLIVCACVCLAVCRFSFVFCGHTLLFDLEIFRYLERCGTDFTKITFLMFNRPECKGLTRADLLITSRTTDFLRSLNGTKFKYDFNFDVNKKQNFKNKSFN